jgi:hypothetical protein
MNNTISFESIKEIAELLDCGMLCFYNRTTGEVDYHPDPYKNVGYDEEQWADVIDRIDENYGDYARFEGIEGNQAFRVMADFVDQIDSLKIRAKFIDALSGRKPFQQFKSLIPYYPDLRQQWFSYKTSRYIEFVKEQAGEFGLL